MRREYGQPCTRCCWSACTRQDSSTGAVPPWTARLSRQKGGCRDRTKSDGSRQAGQQAPHRGRCQRHAARCADRTRQLARQPHAGADAGRHPFGEERKTWPTAMPARQAACRQGLRLPALPPGVPRPRHPVPYRQAGRRQQPTPWTCHRWVVERTHAWLNRLRRLCVRYERRADIFLAFNILGCALVCLKQIRRFC